MGTEAVWVPLVMAAVGTAASVYNTRSVARKQDNQLATSIRKQGDKQKVADQVTNKLIDQQSSSSPQASQAAALAQHLSALKAGQGSALTGLGSNVIGGGDRFQKDAADAATGVVDYGNRKATLASIIDGAKLQRQGEAFQRARGGVDLGLVSRESAGQAFLDNLRLQSIQRSPGLDLAAGLAQGAASSYGSWGGGAGGSPAYGTIGSVNSGNFLGPR